MISLSYENSAAYVWNADDWYELRTKHRVCGTLIGSLPSHPRQNDYLGLPMELMPEETALLLEKNISELYELTDLTKDPTEAQKQEEEALEKRLFEEQGREQRKRKIEQISQKIDVIVAGKRKKLQSKGIPETEAILDKEVLLQEQISRIPELTNENVLVHLPTRYQWQSEKKKLTIENITPSVLEGDGKIRYVVYKDLWERGYYITSGLKFGADFLVYPGDPVQFHATYMVRCVDRADAMRPATVVAFGRLSVAVHKMAVLASCNGNGHVNYQTVQWHDSVNG